MKNGKGNIFVTRDMESQSSDNAEVRISRNHNVKIKMRCRRPEDFHFWQNGG